MFFDNVQARTVTALELPHLNASSFWMFEFSLLIRVKLNWGICGIVQIKQSAFSVTLRARDGSQHNSLVLDKHRVAPAALRVDFSFLAVPCKRSWSGFKALRLRLSFWFTVVHCHFTELNLVLHCSYFRFYSSLMHKFYTYCLNTVEKINLFR